MSVSWVDRLIGAVGRLPVAAWIIYAVAALVVMLAIHVVHWVSGAIPAGAVRIPLLVTSTWSLVGLGMLDYSYRVARRSFNSFCTILAPSDAFDTKWLATFTSVPAKAAWLAIPGGLAYFGTIYLYDHTFFGLLSGRLLSDLFLVVFGICNSIVIVVNCYQAIRDLITIENVQSLVVHPILFLRHPLFAFSGLSSYIAICFAAQTYIFWLAFPTALANPVAYGFILVIAMPVALACFFIPLAGMHQRMVAEKERLRSDTGRRIKETREQFHKHLEAMDLASMDAMNKALSSLILEEEYIRKIRTWPWEPSTLNAVLTAVFLPILLFIVERLLAKTLGW